MTFRLQQRTTDPPTPAAGEMLLYPKTDGFYVRLSDGTVYPLVAAGALDDLFAVGASRASLNTTDLYLRYHQNVPTNLSPIILPIDSTLIGMGASGSASQTWQAQVRLGGTLVSGAILNITAATSAFRNDLSIDFDAGDGIQLYCLGTNISYPTITAVFKKR